MQDDTNIENMKLMTQICREHGAYSAGSYKLPTSMPPCETPASVGDRKNLAGMAGRPQPRIRPGVCFPWEERVKELPEITGSKELVKKIWEDIDAFGSVYIYQLLESF
jgi:hypothetical protein